MRAWALARRMLRRPLAALTMLQADGGSWLGQIGDPMLNEKKRHSRD